MTKINFLTSEVEKLSDTEKRELVDKLLKTMSKAQIKQLIDRNINDEELLNILKAAEPLFSDWENEEDAIYDNL